MGRIRPKAGEVWFADLGITAKSRPVLILYSPQAQDARNLVFVAPLTSRIRHRRGEIPLGSVPWLPNHPYLETSDVILLVSGGHDFEVLEDTDMIEVKQGPYSGVEDKERFEPAE